MRLPGFPTKELALNRSAYATVTRVSGGSIYMGVGAKMVKTTAEGPARVHFKLLT